MPPMPMPPVLALAALEAPQVPHEHNVVPDLLEEARSQVEQGVTALLNGQVLSVFEGLLGGETQAAPAELSLERSLGEILCVSVCGKSCRCSSSLLSVPFYLTRSFLSRRLSACPVFPTGAGELK